MSKGWAAIVYGRTYHLDFRFITVPQDFTQQDLNWASQHIVATTQQARNLFASPRWSLFKNNNYCVVGITCMVKDLIGNTVKDDQGRPLYIFVGYVTQLTENLVIQNLPAYAENCLDNFKILYQAIEQVWVVKDYELDSKHPSLSSYEPINFGNSAIVFEPQELPPLNQQSRHPDKIYLWQSSTQQNSLLWQTAAQSSVPVATCLNIQGKALNNSPFLNQSTTQTEQFQILERVTTQGKYHPLDTANDNQADPPNTSLSQKIADRAKEDLDLTLQQANKMAIASQELINNLSDWNHTSTIKPQDLNPSVTEPEFGFKTKKSNSSESEQDWF
ncbi:MAG: hypothetical protein HC764_22725 [Pleurocapsa sp. CRU_1_2]|nr:hypothetical protein [Pleurocapsa sp. CRU_1_2]